MESITNNKFIGLLELAQKGDKTAEEQLIIGLRDTVMRKRIGKYLSRNRQVENDDLIQEFLIGISIAIPRARLDIGDPIEYIIKQGVFRVRTYLRSNIMKRTTQVCMDCGFESRLHKVDGKYECRKCKSNNITTREINENDETLFETMTVNNSEAELEDIMFEMVINKFEETLDRGTNVYQLYMLLKSGINRDNPEIKNYIKEIAEIWGGCSTTNVLQNMNKLQAKMVKFASDHGIDIKENKFVL